MRFPTAGKAALFAALFVPGPAGAGGWAFHGDAGLALPSGLLADRWKAGPSLRLGVERNLGSRGSLGAEAGFASFSFDPFQGAEADSARLLSFLLRARFFSGSPASGLRPYGFLAGGAGYLQVTVPLAVVSPPVLVSADEGALALGAGVGARLPAGSAMFFYVEAGYLRYFTEGEGTGVVPVAFGMGFW